MLYCNLMNKLNFNEVFFLCDATLCEVCVCVRSEERDSAVSPLTISKRTCVHAHASTASPLRRDQPKEGRCIRSQWIMTVLWPVAERNLFPL